MNFEVSFVIYLLMLYLIHNIPMGQEISFSRTPLAQSLKEFQLPFVLAG
jgi:hypothetical protein